MKTPGTEFAKSRCDPPLTSAVQCAAGQVHYQGSGDLSSALNAAPDVKSLDATGRSKSLWHLMVQMLAAGML